VIGVVEKENENNNIKYTRKVFIESFILGLDLNLHRSNEIVYFQSQ